MKEGMTYSDWYRIQLYYSDKLVLWSWQRMLYMTSVVWQASS